MEFIWRRPKRLILVSVDCKDNDSLSNLADETIGAGLVLPQTNIERQTDVQSTTENKEWYFLGP